MKYALVIGNSRYTDPKLSQLKTPEADSRELAKVLKAKRLGGFDEVALVLNQTESKTRRSISSFLANKGPDDLVLMYFSGHGVLDDRGGLFLALKDTQYRALNATAISSSFISYELDNCRSRQQILILDCCNSGAFGRGTKGEQKAVTKSTFEGNGSGRIVLTASDATQFAFEGDQVIPKAELSLFTHFLLEGLKTGEADKDHDGKVSLDEWYDYCHSRITQKTPKQVPNKWTYRQQGEVIISRNPFAGKKLKAERQPKSVQLRGMLDQKQLEFQRHKLLLDTKELAIIANELARTKLELRSEDRQLILLSAVTNGEGHKWLAINGDEGVVWLRKAYQSETNSLETRWGAVRFLGEMEDSLTFEHLANACQQNLEPTERKLLLDLLAQYLRGSMRVHRLPFSVKIALSWRLVTNEFQESVKERTYVSIRSAMMGFICSFIAFYLSPSGSAFPLILLIGFFWAAVGAVIAFVFAQIVTFAVRITGKWMFLWQVLTLSLVGTLTGLGLIFFVTTYFHSPLFGGLLGITQSVISRERKKSRANAWVILSVFLIVAYIAIALMMKIPQGENPAGYIFSAGLFTATYLYSVLRAKSFM